MKYFIFMYPIAEYINHESEHYLLHPDKFAPDMYFLNKLIDARYRKRNFKIVWVLFFNNSGKPDYKSISNYINIHKNDIIIGSGITRQQNKNYIYPDPRFIIHQLPERIDEIIIGGYHQSDCVARIACYSHYNDIKVFVDEDTTELYFCRKILQINIPLIRTDFSLEALGINKEYMEMAIEIRKDKPWLVQC